MLALFLRAVGGRPGHAQPGVLQQLLLQSSGAVQELVRWDACGGPSSPASEALDALCVPSTSYGQPPHRPHTRHPCLHGQQPPDATVAGATGGLQLQQLRAYRIPNKVLQPKVPYSVRSGRPAPQPWPELGPLKAPAGELRWHRSVVRFPPEVSVELREAGEQGQGRTLIISGKAGTIRLDLQALDPTGLLAFRLVRLPVAAGGASATTAAAAAPPSPAVAKVAGAAQAPAGGDSAAAAAAVRSMLVLVGPDKASFEAVGAELNKAIRGVMAGYLLGLTVKGVGYRMEPLEDGAGEGLARIVGLTAAQLARRKRAPGGGTPKPYYFESSSVEKQSVTFPHNKPASAIRLKVGYSRTAVYPLPPHVRAFFLKPTLLYLYGLELDELRRVAAEIRSIRKPNPYTGNGVQYVDEVVRIKQRAGAK